ncbi:MAG: TIGR01458 family HAD-type hydrolase [Halioglobus sp.]|nr:TIGR01458 family HAD-type hydrolase [Halioglobus sp.]
MPGAVLLDLSGVLYDGDVVIDGAVDAVGCLRASGLELRFITNTSRRTRAELIEHLHGLGFDVAQQQLFTAVDAARAWLRQRGLRPYCLVHDNIRSEFDEFDQRDPDAVFVADAAQGFTYDALNRAFRLCQAGAPLLGVGDNRYFSAGGEMFMDAGAFIHAIEFAADVQAVIVGKPSADFFALALDSAGASAADAFMVGDDVFADVQGALAAGIPACLVRTGKYRAGDENRVTGEFRVVDSIVQLADELLSG